MRDKFGHECFVVCECARVAPTHMEAPLARPPDARANYVALLQFARWVRANRPNGDTSEAAVRVVDQPPMGKGLVAARDIAEGEIVVWYGGPYVPCSSIHRDHDTHALQSPDYDEPAEQQVARAIDGKMVSAAFHDPELVTDAERQDLLLIAGAMVNSSRNLNNEEAMPSMLETSTRLNLLRTPPPRQVDFAAKPFVAKRAIAAGEPIYWSYKISGCPTLPTGFESVVPKPQARQPPQAKQKRRITPLANPGACSSGSSSKAAKTAEMAADASGLVSLAHLRL